MEVMMGKTLETLRRLPEIEYLCPKTLDEVLSLLEKHKGEAKALAGGTDLLPKMKRRDVAPKYLVDLKGIADLHFIKYDKELGLRIGAATTLTEVLESHDIRKHCPI